MSRKDKLIKRFQSLPKDFHFDEAVTLLGYFEYYPVKKGKTSGSRVKFENEDGISILMHKPHPSGLLKGYQIKQIKEFLGL